MLAPACPLLAPSLGGWPALSVTGSVVTLHLGAVLTEAASDDLCLPANGSLGHVEITDMTFEVLFLLVRAKQVAKQ